MQPFHLPRKIALALSGAAWMLAGCAVEDATAVDGTACDGGCGGSRQSKGTGGTPSETAGSGGGGFSGSEGLPSSGGAASGGASGGASAGAPADVDASVASGGMSSALRYSLFVDAPSDRSSVSGVVTVRGRAPGFLNVEVWDAAHQMPPLAQVAPASDGAFSTTVDTTGLASGPTIWTVWGWDSNPGLAFNHSDSVPLSLTIAEQGQPDSGSTDPTGGGSETIGVGDITMPAKGPAPADAAKVGGAAFVLVKNWNFGASGTIKDTTSLISEFQFHDQFNTIANGTNYGAVTVAPNTATAISASNLGLPGSKQPVEDPARPNREWTADSLKAHVRPLSASQTSCSVSAHDTGNGSFTAKWKLPNGGALLGKDILWETRARMPVPLAGYWFALWTAGNQWSKGAEMDVLESFGSPNVYPPPTAFHVNSVGGQDAIDYSSWPSGLGAAGVPAGARDLSAWHVWTWVYKTDDTYKVYFDGYVVQTGTIHWTLGGASGGQAIDMDFLFDFSWGHTQISDVNISLPASSFPLTYEIDYSRVYLR